MSNYIEKNHFADAKAALGQWIHQTLDLEGVGVRYQVRGNNLHILCEGDDPDRITILRRLVFALQETNLNTLMPADAPAIYHLQLYGCKIGQAHSDWTTTIYLNQLDRHVEQLQQEEAEPTESRPEQGQDVEDDLLLSTPSSSPATVALALSNRSLARQGYQTAIAAYLSETLSDLGIAVRVSVKTIAHTVNSNVYSTDIAATASITKRLWVACEASYSPDPSLVGEAITQKLRDLEIEGYRDAVILFQVVGEAKPDWLLRVDLTPPDEMLREWARWGDIEAIQRLLNQAVAHLGVRFSSASLKEQTLHLFCSVLPNTPAAEQSEIPDQQQVKAEIAPLLETLGPQGIHAAAVYGQLSDLDAPAWVEWLELPAAVHPALSDPTLALAQQGDWSAIAFLLHRLVNSNLKTYLATGGIRLQLLPKQDLLHIMSEAVFCPDQRQVGYTIARFLRQLKLSHIAGVRVYGRRAGQKHPLWSYGVDFLPRNRMVPEATPEFAASDAYVNDLIGKPGEPAIRPDLTPSDIQTAWSNLCHRLVHWTQKILIRSQVFVSIEESEVSSLALPNQVKHQGAKLALVWGAVGVLLVVQTNWLLEKVLRHDAAQSAAHSTVTPAQSPAPPVSAVSSTTPVETAEPSEFSLTELELQRSTAEEDAFNAERFTESPSTPAKSDPQATPSNPPASAESASLPYTPQNPAANLALAEALAESTLPDFNSRQLKDKLELYYQFLETYGPPDVLVVGSSRALRGVDPAALEQALADLGYRDVKVFNFGINGATAQVIDLVVRQMLYPEQLPRLIIWADGARAFNSNAVDVTYNGIVASPAYQQLAEGTLTLPGAGQAETATENSEASQASNQGINKTLTDSYQSLDRWLSRRLATLSRTYDERDRFKKLLQDGLIGLMPIPAASPVPTEAMTPGVVAQSPNPNLPGNYELVDMDGFLSLGVQFNPATYYQQYARVSGAYDRDYTDFRISGSQEDALLNFLQYTQAQQVPLVFVNLPLTDEYLDSARMEYEQQFRAYMVNLSLRQPGFVFRDLGELWTTEYDYFSDPSHLNRYGAYAVSNHLAQDPMIPWPKAAENQE